MKLRDDQALRDDARDAIENLHVDDAITAILDAVERHQQVALPAVGGATAQPRESGCQCQWEIGDSPCRVHGEEEDPPPPVSGSPTPFDVVLKQAEAALPGNHPPFDRDDEGRPRPRAHCNSVSGSPQAGEGDDEDCPHCANTGMVTLGLGVLGPCPRHCSPLGRTPSSPPVDQEKP